MPAEFGNGRGEIKPRESAHLPAAKPAPVTGLRRFEEFDRLVGGELGTLREGADPLLEQARALFLALSPAADVEPLSPEAKAKNRADLAGVLDQLEDLLDALQLAARGGNLARKRG